MSKVDILVATDSNHVKKIFNKVFNDNSSSIKDKVNILYLDDIKCNRMVAIENISYEDNALDTAMYYAKETNINIVVGLSYALEVECWNFEKPKDLSCISNIDYTNFIEETKKKTKCSSCDYSSIACFYVKDTKQTEFGYGFLDGFFKPFEPKGEESNDYIRRFDNRFYLSKMVWDDIKIKGNRVSVPITKAEIDNAKTKIKIEYTDPLYQSFAVLYEKLKKII